VTSRYRRTGATAALLALAAAVPAAGASRPAAAPGGGGANVVVAIVDSGVNAYHDEFSRPGLTAHPSTYLPGYPKAARALRLSLQEDDYERASDADDAQWRGIKPGELRWVPGTNLAGIVHLPGSPLDGAQSVEVSSEPQDEPRPVLDEYQYHGTGVASVLAGRTTGACPRCLIVLVQADDKEQGLAWAAAQPWIDVISNSWGGPLGVPTRATGGNPDRAAQTDAEFSRKAAAAGKLVLFASGNGSSGLGGIVPGPTQHNTTYDSPFAGPPWVFTVGAAKPNGQPTNWHGIPVDVIAQGEQRPAAAEETTDGISTFLGTSCATPIAAGVLAQALLNARQAVGDTRTGARNGTLVVPAPGRAPKTGPLADRRLTRTELADAARAVAAWQPFDPSTVASDPLLTPTTDLSYAYQGHGLLDTDRAPLLTDVLLGRAPAPARPEMGDWAAQHQQRRAAIWGTDPS
jgi:subtilisin family serine protease